MSPSATSHSRNLKLLLPHRGGLHCHLHLPPGLSAVYELSEPANCFFRWQKCRQLQRERDLGLPAGARMHPGPGLSLGMQGVRHCSSFLLVDVVGRWAWKMGLTLNSLQLPFSVEYFQGPSVSLARKSQVHRSGLSGTVEKVEPSYSPVLLSGQTAKGWAREGYGMALSRSQGQGLIRLG